LTSFACQSCGAVWHSASHVDPTQQKCLRCGGELAPEADAHPSNPGPDGEDDDPEDSID
jgi:hypothetical protein